MVWKLTIFADDRPALSEGRAKCVARLPEMLSNLKQCCLDLNKPCLLFLKLYKPWEIRLLQLRKGISSPRISALPVITPNSRT